MASRSKMRGARPGELATGGRADLQRTGRRRNAHHQNVVKIRNRGLQAGEIKAGRGSLNRSKGGESSAAGVMTNASRAAFSIASRPRMTKCLTAEVNIYEFVAHCQ